MAQQLSTPLLIHFDRPLHDRRLGCGGGGHFDADRIAQQRFRKRFYSRRKRCRDQYTLTLPRQQAEDARQFFREAELEQLVGFIQHQRRDRRERERIVIHQIQ